MRLRADARFLVNDHAVQHRARVNGEWGFASRLALGKGVAALFAGKFQHLPHFVARRTPRISDQVK